MWELLGLGAMPQAVYTLMLEQPELDLPGLQAALGISETELRAALDDLAGLALVRWIRDKGDGLPVFPHDTDARPRDPGTRPASQGCPASRG